MFESDVILNGIAMKDLSLELNYSIQPTISLLEARIQRNHYRKPRMQVLHSRQRRTIENKVEERIHL